MVGYNIAVRYPPRQSAPFAGLVSSRFLEGEKRREKKKIE